MQKPNAVLDYLGSPCRGLEVDFIDFLIKNASVLTKINLQVNFY